MTELTWQTGGTFRRHPGRTSAHRRSVDWGHGLWLVWCGAV